MLLGQSDDILTMQVNRNRVNLLFLSLNLILSLSLFFKYLISDRYICWIHLEPSEVIIFQKIQKEVIQMVTLINHLNISVMVVFFQVHIMKNKAENIMLVSHQGYFTTSTSRRF
ncbi:hypothetical protein QQ045_026470 [Rhodiola kirilowii]